MSDCHCIRYQNIKPSVLWNMQTINLICKQMKKNTFLHNDSDIQTFLGVSNSKNFKL